MGYNRLGLPVFIKVFCMNKRPRALGIGRLSFEGEISKTDVDSPRDVPGA